MKTGAILVETSSLTKLCAGDGGEQLGIAECKRSRPTAALRRVVDQAIPAVFQGCRYYGKRGSASYIVRQ